MKLPHDQTTRVRRGLSALLLLLPLSLAASGCGSSDEEDSGARTTRTTTTARTTPTATATTPEASQSTDVPGTVPVQGASPGVPAAPQGGAPTGSAPQPTTATGGDAATGQSADERAVTQGTSTGGTSGSPPPASAGSLPEGSDSGPAAPVVGASGGARTSRFGAFEGDRPFSASSPWNTAASGLPVDPRSAQMMRLANVRLAIIDRGGGELERVETVNDEGLFINRRAWAPPIYTEEGGVSTTFRCRQILRNCGDVIDTLAIAPEARPDPRYDGWFTVYDSPNGVAYDFWRARRESDGSISYHFARRWDLNDSGYLPPQKVSARGSGLPLFAGVITPADIQRGRIDHALAISVPGAAQRRYVQPASRTDGNGNINSLPEGARIRLRADIDAADLLARGDRGDRRGRRGRDDRDRGQGLFEGTSFDRLSTRSGDPDDPVTAPRDPVTGDRLRGTDEIEQIDEVNYDQLLESLRPDRFRVEENTRRRITEMILDALKRYGAIVVDRSAVPTLYAQRNVDWRGVLTGNEIQEVKLSDFEVIQLGPVYVDPPLTEDVSVALPGASAPGVEQSPQAAGAGTTGTTTTPTTTTTPAPTTTGAE